MRSLIFGTLIITCGCGGSVDTPASVKPEQQLTSLVPTWCPQICAKLSQCMASGTDTGCATDCTDDLNREFIGHGDACAQFGLDLVSCLNNASCNDIANNSQICDPNATAEAVACGSGAGSDASAGANPTGPAVSCQSGGGLATAGNVPIGSIICDNSYTACSDGHTYEFSCVNQGNNQLGCTCYLDSTSQATFITTGTTCPSVQIVDAACGWQLTGS